MTPYKVFGHPKIPQNHRNSTGNVKEIERYIEIHPFKSFLACLLIYIAKTNFSGKKMFFFAVKSTFWGILGCPKTL